MTKTVSRDLIESALDNAGLDHNGVEDEYIGRSMYGQHCFAFTLRGKRSIQRDLCRFFAWLASDLVEARVVEGMDVAHELAGDVHTDDLGLDMIVYFPGWTLAD